MQKTAKALIVVAALLTSGCGAIFNGSTKSIDIQGTSGATITGEDLGVLTVPTIIELERKHSYVLTFSKPGYKDATVKIRKKLMTGVLIADVLLTGLIGVVVDAMTGSWNTLTPDQVSVSLEKEDVGVIGPDIIDITLSTIDKGKQFDIQSEIPVNMHIVKSSR